MTTLFRMRGTGFHKFPPVQGDIPTRCRVQNGDVMLCRDAGPLKPSVNGEQVNADVASKLLPAWPPLYDLLRGCEFLAHAIPYNDQFGHCQRGPTWLLP